MGSTRTQLYCLLHYLIKLNLNYYYSSNLGSEFTIEQICSQTGLPRDLPEEVLVEKGFYPVVDPRKNSWVFFNPPSFFRVNEEEGVAYVHLQEEEKNLEEVKYRARSLLNNNTKEALERLLEDPEIRTDVLINGVLGLGEKGSHFTSLSSLVWQNKKRVSRVNKAEGSLEIQEILAEYELFNISQ